MQNISKSNEEAVKREDEKYFGDKASRSFIFTWSEVDRLPQSEYGKLDKLRKKIFEELDNNPGMTEGEANLLAWEIDATIVKKHNVRIEFPGDHKKMFVSRSLGLEW